jgi:hypothetical protein
MEYLESTPLSIVKTQVQFLQRYQLHKPDFDTIEFFLSEFVSQNLILEV